MLSGSVWAPALLVAASIVTIAFGAWRWSKVTPRYRPPRQLVWAAPSVLAGLSLLVYATVLIPVHRHYQKTLVSALVVRISSAENQLRQLEEAAARHAHIYARALSESTTASTREITLGNLLAAEQMALRAQLHRTPTDEPAVSHLHAEVQQTTVALAVANRRSNQLDQNVVSSGQAANTAMQAVFTFRRVFLPPAATQLPAWFDRLQGTFSVAAQILAALVLALVFSRRRSMHPYVNDAFFIALLISLIGLLSAAVGIVPSLPGAAQAVLLGYTLAGLLSSRSAVLLIAGGWAP